MVIILPSGTIFLGTMGGDGVAELVGGPLILVWIAFTSSLGRYYSSSIIPSTMSQMIFTLEFSMSSSSCSISCSCSSSSSTTRIWLPGGGNLFLLTKCFQVCLDMDSSATFLLMSIISLARLLTNLCNISISKAS